MSRYKGGFTLPGEAGYEELTLRLAEKWGADVIRDSDGTALSDEILNAGYEIYSTICIIRDHNAWARENMGALQQTFLMTPPKTAESGELEIGLLDAFFREQFSINESDESLALWQVFDRTSNTEVARGNWTYLPEKGAVSIRGITPWHNYTVNFLAWRVWEEISMYNHVTNCWDKEHLMQLDPMHPGASEYLLSWMEDWCLSHPGTNVVRFTSLFYNFVWIWGGDERNRHLFTDWSSYDFTVSPRALALFEKKYGYRLCSEDFINKGRLYSAHMAPDAKKLDWMSFIGGFVSDMGRRLVDIAHRHGKKAYVFYDDSWVGLEPYSERFESIGFDGIIKCVFSGFETRLCAGVKADVHELRLHPYLFPVGLGGLPTFMDGGDPTLDAKKYWNSVRRALLREPVQRIGLGGYIHLVEEFPDFCDYIEEVKDEFDEIRSYHDAGRPYALKPRVAVLHAWGKLRSWTLSGHMHETDEHDLIHILESLSGLPLDVSFLSFEDIEGGVPKNIDVIINAGAKGTAWSGGSRWQNEAAVESLTKWVHGGGVFIGVNEPSAADGFGTVFRMAHVLGVDGESAGSYCHGRWKYDVVAAPGLIPEGVELRPANVRLTDGRATVLAERDGRPAVTENDFGAGKGVYISSMAARAENRPANTRLLLNIILRACGESLSQECVTDSPDTECAFFPCSGRLVLINNCGGARHTRVWVGGCLFEAELAPYETKIFESAGDNPAERLP